ncbi:hypothetical protein PRZ48_007114 [Zasmidium cellare]|uniref:Uncharacterized protein n=1 Tax=Zasmidium cellare TaxID=395010 RepID=A0ABR0EJA1_ZASCE|nr:hypothetical protein PRZ48_007114 [Zasmidium cellare]
MTSNAPVTQIIHLGFKRNTDANLDDAGLWSEALNACEKSPGLQRLYWARSLEHPEHVELHLVRQSLSQHQDYLKSPNHKTFLAIIEKLSAQIKSIRHAQIKSWTPTDKSLARGAPVTGTAIYFNTTEVWNDYVWPLWTHIVRHIDGCIGCSGGPLLEPVTVVPGLLGEGLSGKGEEKTFETGVEREAGWESEIVRKDDGSSFSYR